MPFIAIKGTFHIKGYSPDGDSVRFKALNSKNWDKLSGSLWNLKKKLKKKKEVQLRFEAIDTLETHYKGTHQPPLWADNATNHLFKLLGIKNVVWNDKRSKVISADDGVPGYILSRMVERNGRPVSFVFDSSVDWKDGESVRLNKIISRRSANYKMIITGLAYPTFYDGMFYDLRELFADASYKAKDNKLGFWSEDRTNRYTSISNISDIKEKYIMLPKLFRRICAYLKKNGCFDAKDFIKSLSKKPEKVLILSRLHFTHLDNLIKVNSQGKLKMTQTPEDIVFIG